MHLHHAASDTSAFPMAPPIKALLLDDSSFDRERIRRMTRKTDLALLLDEVSSLRDMKRAVQAETYDLILIDYRLPEGDGLSALDTIHADPRNKDAGTIMITGDAGADTAMTAMRNGCHDFLTKDAMTVDLLRRAMMNAMMVSHRNQLQVMESRAQAHVRDTVALALSDASMQDTLVSIVQGHFRNAGAVMGRGSPLSEDQELTLMVEAMMRDDEFIFH